MKKNGFSVLLIIIIVLAWLGLGYFVYKNYSILFPQKVAVKVTPDPDSATGDERPVGITGEDSKWISATESQFESWKTYTDKTKLFSIQYPTAWNVRESGATTILTPDAPCATCSSLPTGIRISVIDNKDNLSAKDYVTRNVITTSGSISKDQPGFLEGMDAILVEGQAGDGTPGPTEYIRSGNKMIILASNGVGNDILVGQIFWTFSFPHP